MKFQRFSFSFLLQLKSGIKRDNSCHSAKILQNHRLNWTKTT